LTKQNIVGISVLSCACGIAGYVLSRCGLYLPLWMDSALTAMPFFLMGYVLRKYSNLLYGEKSLLDLFYGLLCLLFLLGVYWFDECQNTGVIAYGDNEFDISALCLYLGGFSGTIFVLIVSKWLNHVWGFSYVGRYSIVVLLTHLLYLFVIRNVLYQLNVPQDDVYVNFMVFVVIMLMEIPTIWFCIRYLPYCFAQKDLWK
jgi:fucose 4-O-acetylase-like acetyltransferase